MLKKYSYTNINKVCSIGKENLFNTIQFLFCILFICFLYNNALCGSKENQELVNNFCRDIKARPLQSTYMILHLRSVLTTKQIEDELCRILKEKFDTILGYPYGTFESGSLKRLHGIETENLDFTCIRTMRKFIFNRKYYYLFFIYDNKNGLLSLSVSYTDYSEKKITKSKTIGKKIAFLIKKKLECEIIGMVAFNTKIKMLK